MLALLRTRRWIAFTGLVLAVIIAFGFLSRWQWHRAEEKRQEGAIIVNAAEQQAQLLDLTDPPPEWTSVSVTGEYLPDSLMVRQRPQEGQNGAWVLSTLITAPTLGDPQQSTTEQPKKVWVSRGWLPVTGVATEIPPLPAPPSGEITVTGVWRPYEPVDMDRMAGLPTGMVPAVGPPAIADEGYAAGYVQLSSMENGLTTVQLPDINDSRNLSYAIQWVLFALVGLVGWWFFLRREAAEDAAESLKKVDVA